jgi:hypothetical protein
MDASFRKVGGRQVRRRRFAARAPAEPCGGRVGHVQVEALWAEIGR